MGANNFRQGSVVRHAWRRYLRYWLDPITSGHAIETLGATLGQDMGGGRMIAGYANIDHSDRANVWTTSINFGFPISGNFGAYLEVGRMDGDGTTSTVAGGDVTYLVNSCVQFDLYPRHGLTSESPDVQAGFGISLVLEINRSWLNEGRSTMQALQPRSAFSQLSGRRLLRASSQSNPQWRIGP